MDCLGALGHNLYNKLCCGVHEAGHGHDYRFQKVEPMLGEWAAHGHPTVLFRTIKISLGLCELDKKTSMCGVSRQQLQWNHLHSSNPVVASRQFTCRDITMLSRHHDAIATSLS